MKSLIPKFLREGKAPGPSMLAFLGQVYRMDFKRSLRPAGLDFPRAPWLALLLIAYLAVLAGLGGLTKDHFLLCGFVSFLYYWKLGTRRLLFFLSPLVLSAILYDSMRHYADYIRGPVHVHQPYNAEKFLFGLPTGEGGALETPNEFLQKHTNVAFDFLCGLSYLTFIFEFIFLCFYFFFTGLWDYLRRAGWCFFWVNFLGYCTYYLYAAAPPWYVALHGLGPAKMDTPANSAGAARFDAIFGTEFFVGMYGKSADVFGAIPSLHVTYPFLAMIFAFQMRRFRAFSVGFFLLMCFSAVYLNHHYILDVVVGIAYATITFLCVERYYYQRPIDPDRIY